MFKGIFKNQSEKKIEQQISDLKLYLENNYKDLAIKARKEAISLVESSFQAGKINEKSYEKYSGLLDEYTKQMKHYNHQQFYQS